MKAMTIVSDKTVTYVKENYSIQLAVLPFIIQRTITKGAYDNFSDQELLDEQCLDFVFAYCRK